MSMEQYLRLHELLNQLPPWPIMVHPKAPHIKPRPRVTYNVVYFMYQKGEVITSGGKTFERIVYVGKGNEERLNSYTRINWFPPLKIKVQKALAAQKGLSADAIGNIEVDDYIKYNFQCRIIPVSSDDEAKEWEKKIIPTIAKQSKDFISANWIGKLAGLHYGIWNTIYAYHPEILKDEDLDKLDKLIKKLLGDIIF